MTIVNCNNCFAENPHIVREGNEEDVRRAVAKAPTDLEGSRIYYKKINQSNQIIKFI